MGYDLDIIGAARRDAEDDPPDVVDRKTWRRRPGHRWHHFSPEREFAGRSVAPELSGVPRGS